MTVSDPRALLAAAVAAAERGWPVFLLGRSKRPLANCPQCPKQREPGAHNGETCECLTCHGFYAATRDPDRITAMVAAHPDGLLAVRTGAAPAGAGVVVIDIDPGHGGRYNRDLMAPTRCVATGNHGWHLYYRHPDHPVLSRPLPGTVGVDVKADGGYVVLPPSVHPTTRRPYRWTNQRGIEEMPPRLADTVLTPPTAPTAALTTTAKPVHGGGSSRTGPRATTAGQRVRHPDGFVRSCLAAVRRAPEGTRRVTLYGAARGIARAIHAGFDPTTGVDRLIEVGREAEQSERDIHAAITAGFAAEGLTVGLTGGHTHP